MAGSGIDQKAYQPGTPEYLAHAEYASADYVEKWEYPTHVMKVRQRAEEHAARKSAVTR